MQPLAVFPQSLCGGEGVLSSKLCLGGTRSRMLGFLSEKRVWIVKLSSSR